jgi:hypothetical protein
VAGVPKGLVAAVERQPEVDRKQLRASVDKALRKDVVGRWHGTWEPTKMARELAPQGICYHP